MKQFKETQITKCLLKRIEDELKLVINEIDSIEDNCSIEEKLTDRAKVLWDAQNKLSLTIATIQEYFYK